MSVPGTGRPLRRRNAETLVCELDDDGVRRVRLVLILWVLFAFNMGFGDADAHFRGNGGSFFGNFMGQARLDPQQLIA